MVALDNITITTSRNRIARLICDAALLYKERLVGKTFLYVYDNNKYIDVSFFTAINHQMFLNSFLRLSLCFLFSCITESKIYSLSFRQSERDVSKYILFPVSRS